LETLRLKNIETNLKREINELNNDIEEIDEFKMVLEKPVKP